MIWRCPLHHGTLHQEPGGHELTAACCGTGFPVIAGIPDFRIAQPSWVDDAEDRRRAEDLVEAVPSGDVEGSIRHVFGRREGWTEVRIERRTRQVLAAVDRLREEVQGWLAPVTTLQGPVLDLGCGPGMLLAALGPAQRVIGLDVSLEWLVVAQRLTSAAGVTAELAAGHAEAMPLATGTVGAVAALDVLEHVGDQAAMIREVDRVLKVGGVLAMATPNRFSLMAEPHVGIWGVGWLPRSWQARYVRRRTGFSYAFTRLLSAREIGGLLDRNSSMRGSPNPAPIPRYELARFGARRRILARVYNALLPLGPVRAFCRHFGPFLHLVATKTANPPRS
jgi:2-polyprenyl-3-methyl-5-hydroxy-6-metoxy-1,4-benzoquinol methylase